MILSVKKFYQKTFLTFLFTMTSEHSQQNLFNTTSYQEDSPVKTSQLQVDKKASRRLQGLVSSTNSSESYAWFDQNTSSWRTYQRSLITELDIVLAELYEAGLYECRMGNFFQRALLELPTNETDGGFENLPTPLASDRMEHNSNYLRAVIDRDDITQLMKIYQGNYRGQHQDTMERGKEGHHYRI